MKSPVVKHSVVLARHKASVSLEEAFWQGLKDIAASRRMTLSAVSLRQPCCFAKACRRTRVIFSSTLSCRMRRTARCSENRAGRFTLGLLRRSKPTSPRLRGTNLNWWRGIAARLGCLRKPLSSGGKAGRRSLSRSALAEAAVQLTRALDQIATLPATPELRAEQIELQVAAICLHWQGLASEQAINRPAYLGHKSIQHTVRYTELAPTRFKSLFRD